MTTTLDNWGMCCPGCFAHDQLDVEASVMVRLTGGGTDADASNDGAHEWTDNSRITCSACGWGGVVSDAENAGREYKLANSKPVTIRVRMSETVHYEFDMPVDRADVANGLSYEDMALDFFANDGPKPEWFSHAEDRTVDSCEPIGEKDDA